MNSGIYLLNTSRRHGVINYSYEPRYSGFFTISEEIDYEDARGVINDVKGDGKRHKKNYSR